MGLLQKSQSSEVGGGHYSVVQEKKKGYDKKNEAQSKGLAVSVTSCEVPVCPLALASVCNPQTPDPASTPSSPLLHSYGDSMDLKTPM